MTISFQQLFGALFLAAVILLGTCAESCASEPATSGAAGEPILLAGIWAQSGRAARSTRQLIEGAQCGVRYVNENGGVHGRPFKLVVYDSQSTPEGAKKAVERAAQENPTVLLGAAWSNFTLPVARMAQAHGIPLISSVATNPNITLVGDYIFRVCFSDNLQGKVLAVFARSELGLKRAAVLYDSESDYSMNLSRSFTRTFTELGGAIVLEQPYRYHDGSYDSLVDMAMQAKPDLLFVPGHDESATILQIAQNKGLDAVFLGGDGWDVPSFMEKGGNTLSQAYFSTHWDTELNGPMHTRFLEYCDMPETSSALAFDAVLLAAEALRRADPEDPASVRDALATTRNFVGVTGTLDIMVGGDAIKPVVVKRIVNGEISLVRRYIP